MRLERKLLLLGMIPLGFGLIPAVLKLHEAHSTVKEMEKLTLLASLVWKMAEVEQGLEMEQANWWRFTADHANDTSEQKQEARALEDVAIAKTAAALESYDRMAGHDRYGLDQSAASRGPSND